MQSFSSSLAILICSLAPVPRAMSPSAYLSESAAQEVELVHLFSDDRVWQPEFKVELLMQLKIAGLVRPKMILPVLVRHLGYVDTRYEHNHAVPSYEMLYPVFGVLKQYGANAVPDLFAYLRKSDGIADGRTARLELFLAAMILRDLSDDSIVGREMARSRVKREIDKFPKQQLPRLEAMLALPLLK